MRAAPAVLLALLATPAVAQGRDPHVVARYEGKYAGAPWVQTLLADLPRKAGDALAVACERLGVPRSSVDGTRITVVLTDAASGTEARFPALDPAPAFTATRPEDRAASQSVVLFTEWLGRSHGWAVDGILRHELTHAVLAQRLPAAVALPAWVEEGLAVWASGDGDAFVRRSALFRALRRDTESVCDGLESLVSDLHRGADYAEDYLAFVYLTELGGEGAVRSFVAQLIAGKGFAEAIHGACQRGWAAFHAGARLHATARLTGQKDPALKAAIAVLRAANARRDQETLTLATRFLAEHGKAPEVGAVLFVRAAALVNLRKLDEGLVAFQQALDRGSQFDDGALFYVATLQGAAGNHAAAVAAWEELARDHPETPRLPEAAFDWGFALDAAGRTDDARRVLAKCLATWPQPRDPKRFDRARALLAKE